MKHGLKLVFTAVVLAVFLCGGAITYSRLRYAIPLGPVSNLTFGDAANAASPQQFRLLVWNVYKGQRGNWVDEFQKVAADFD
ncbi:MAG TPA: hypothetical protein PLP17_04575, partial [Oligoflexia bacterium]|nr:hypothetical protein [Oligoflexia bacterium]